MIIIVEISEILDGIVITDAAEIRGNIYLPERDGDAVITWKSSRPDIISDCRTGKKAPGCVNRAADDTKVALTATVSLGNETGERSFEVLVKAAPKKLREDDFTGYLFGHFIGEAAENEEQIYFAVSDDGLHFRDLNNGQPVLLSNVGECGVRDPYICRSKEGDRYFLIATDLSIYHRGGWFLNEQGYYDPSTTGSSSLVLWESGDLVNWGRPRLLPVAPENAGMAWAPEMVYDDETGDYIIFFSSSIMNPETKYKAKPNAIYYVATRDFIHFSEVSLFIDNQSDGENGGRKREIIDTTVLKVGDFYYSASKDGDNAEAGGGIRIMKTRTLLAPDSWEKVLDLDELGLEKQSADGRRLDNGFLEGPELFLFNKKDWRDPNIPEYGLIADRYATGAGYLPIITTDPEDRDNSGNSWRLLKDSEYSFDRLKKRHGTILPITRCELERIKEAYDR